MQEGSDFDQLIGHRKPLTEEGSQSADQLSPKDLIVVLAETRADRRMCFLKSVASV